jgi:hypothetical protein
LLSYPELETGADGAQRAFEAAFACLSLSTTGRTRNLDRQYAIIHWLDELRSWLNTYGRIHAAVTVSDLMLAAAAVGDVLYQVGSKTNATLHKLGLVLGGTRRYNSQALRRVLEQGRFRHPPNRRFLLLGILFASWAEPEVVGVEKPGISSETSGRSLAPLRVEV